MAPLGAHSLDYARESGAKKACSQACRGAGKTRRAINRHPHRGTSPCRAVVPREIPRDVPQEKPDGAVSEPTKFHEFQSPVADEERLDERARAAAYDFEPADRDEKARLPLLRNTSLTRRRISGVRTPARGSSRRVSIFRRASKHRCSKPIFLPRRFSPRGDDDGDSASATEQTSAEIRRAAAWQRKRFQTTSAPTSIGK